MRLPRFFGGGKADDPTPPEPPDDESADNGAPEGDGDETGRQDRNSH